MASDRAGRRARRIDKNGVEKAAGIEGRCVGDERFRAKAEPIQICRETLQPAGRFVDGGHARAGGSKLRRLAARCGAKIERVGARDVAEQVDGQRCGRVLNPPGAGGVTIQIFDAARVVQADGAGRQRNAAEPRGPSLGLGL